MAHRDVVVIGCSVGGVEALQGLVGPLPIDFPASVFVVLHTSPHSRSSLPQILERAGPLPAAHAENGEAIVPGRIYVAPPDHHLLIDDGKVRVVRGPRENRNRPAIDPLFRSAARWCGPRVIGVVLSGALDDGTYGMFAVKQRGGIAIVQDPEEALCGEMPRNVMDKVPVDHAAPVREIAHLLAKLTAETISPREPEVSPSLIKETEIAEFDMDAIEDENRPGTTSEFACPDCGGVLWLQEEQPLMLFRCRVGHAFTADSLQATHSEAVESALWAAMRALEEDASLARRLAGLSEQRQQKKMFDRYKERAREKTQQAAILRNLILEAQNIPQER